MKHDYCALWRPDVYKRRWQGELARYVLLCLSVNIGHLSVNKQVQGHEAAATSCPLAQIQTTDYQKKWSTSAGEVHSIDCVEWADDHFRLGFR